MRILEIPDQKEIKKILQEIRVDPYGIKIMAPKAITYLIRMNSLSCISANILKQEMLSLGGDVAVARDALTGKTKKTDCLIIANSAQINRLNEKLNKQPFGLNRLAKGLSKTLADYQRDKFALELGGYKLNLKKRPFIMGIVNLTPDSFSGNGLYRGLIPKQGILPRQKRILEHIENIVKDGADIIDIGGESSRPGAKPVLLKEELRRTIPVIKKIAKRIKVPISIDTYKPEVARQALDSGAVMVNDISGLRNPKMVKVISKYRAGAVIMHMKGRPQTMQNNPKYKSLIDEIIEYLRLSINRAIEQGVDEEKIVIDPGIGFGKTLEHNLDILRLLREFKVLGRPILVGPSRKSFIGRILNAGPQDRLYGMLSCCVLAVENGANILRVHDVKEVKQSLKITQAILCGNR